MYFIIQIVLDQKFNSKSQVYVYLFQESLVRYRRFEQVHLTVKILTQINGPLQFFLVLSLEINWEYDGIKSLNGMWFILYYQKRNRRSGNYFQGPAACNFLHPLDTMGSHNNHLCIRIIGILRDGFENGPCQNYPLKIKIIFFTEFCNCLFKLCFNLLHRLLRLCGINNMHKADVVLDKFSNPEAMQQRILRKFCMIPGDQYGIPALFHEK